jgi:hypothetical protein
LRTWPLARPIARAASLILALILVAGCERSPELTSIAFIGATGSAQPRVTLGPDGGAVLSWLEPEGRERVLKFARYRNGGFGESTEVARSEQMFVNWADFPSVTPISGDLWFAHWLRRREASGAYDIATAVSRDGGSSWMQAEQMNEDDAVAEHGFVSVFGWDDEIAAFWLDGRELANWSFDNPDELLGTSLRLARFNAQGDATSREVVDDLVCDCCQPDVALTESGPIVAYRDRTPEEIRDVVVRRWSGGGWSEPLNLGNEGWFIEGCPVNGPAIAATGNTVAAIWFTAAEGRPRVRLARSDDGGASFPLVVDVDASGSYGQPGVVLDPDGRALVSWWRRSAEGGIDLMVRAYDRDGGAGPEIRVAHESVGQPIDVPQLVAADGGYLVAWTTFDEGGTVRLARLSL